MPEELSEKEFSQLIKLAKRVLWASPDVKKRIQEHKLNIVPANFYSSIPLMDDIETSFEYRQPGAEVFNHGIFDATKVNSFVDSISAYAYEFEFPIEGNPENPDSFFWANPAFSYSDAMSYYCVLRHFKPDHVLEIGSGFSTLVADAAIKKNGKGALTLIEPFPKPFLRKLDTVDSIIDKFVQDIAVSELTDLVDRSDIWFIDSTHTVKIGSDCLYIYLKVMPNVSTETIVHTHDIYLPYGMPKNQAQEKHIYWTEQYLLYAYMLDNPKIDVLFGSAYTKTALPEAMTKLMHGKYPGGGGSIWYKLSPNLN
ncbi:MAG: class I SAM-dependent methyltransferase [Halioglobus sp.]